MNYDFKSKNPFDLHGFTIQNFFSVVHVRVNSYLTVIENYNMAAWQQKCNVPLSRHMYLSKICSKYTTFFFKIDWPVNVYILVAECTILTVRDVMILFCNAKTQR